MNIFVLDESPEVAAKYHCNKHVVKMILESGQMMCTAHYTHGLRSIGKELSDFKRVRDAKAHAIENLDANILPPWSLSHTRHPCTVWTALNTGNYKWHLRLMRALLDQYTERYQKIHKAESTYSWLENNIPINMMTGDKTAHPQCMPDSCKSTSPVDAYRKYYTNFKQHIAVWEPRSKTPEWYSSGEYKIEI